MKNKYTTEEIHKLISDKVELESKNTALLEALKETVIFLGHIQPRVGEQAFNHIWSIVNGAIIKDNE